MSAAFATWPTRKGRAKKFSIVPPRIALVLMRTANSSSGLSSSQSSAKTLRVPPEHSLPIVTPPWPFFMRQLRMTMFSDGTLTRRPSALRPALIAMQSSPVSNEQFVMRTSRHDSGSQPSVFGPAA